MTNKQLAAPPFTILMAEDDLDDQLLVQEAFDEVYIHNPLKFVNDGEELLDYLKRRGKFTSLKGEPLPGIILLDLNMPRMDGREALEEIKADPALRKIPIVILTTSKAEEDIIRSYDLGASSYIVKPVTLKSLMEVARGLGEYWVQIVTLPYTD